MHCKIKKPVKKMNLYKLWAQCRHLLIEQYYSFVINYRVADGVR